MNAVGIDVSKGKSMVAIMRPFGETVAAPFEVAHTDNEFRQLADRLKSLSGETKIIMEHTGIYHQPIAHALHDAGLFVSTVHAKLVHDYGVGDITGPQLIAEIGALYRFHKKGSLVCFAGLEAPPFQSGKFESENRSISKKGSPHLRRVLFQIMDCYIKNSPVDEPVYQFLDRKRAEGKHYYSYMTAGSAKFLRIYYARVNEFLDKLESDKQALSAEITPAAQ